MFVKWLRNLKARARWRCRLARASERTRRREAYPACFNRLRALRAPGRLYMCVSYMYVPYMCVHCILAILLSMVGILPLPSGIRPARATKGAQKRRRGACPARANMLRGQLYMCVSYMYVYVCIVYVRIYLYSICTFNALGRRERRRGRRGACPARAGPAQHGQTGSCLRLMDFGHHSTLGLRIIKKMERVLLHLSGGYISINLSIYVSIYLSIYLYIYLYIYKSLSLYICRYI